MRSRVITFAMLCATTAPANAHLQEVSPEVIACQNEATQRYIADFQQVSLPRAGSGSANFQFSSQDFKTIRRGLRSMLPNAGSVYA